MNEERKKILELVSQGKVTVEEAEALLGALASKINEEGFAQTSTSQKGNKMPPRYLRLEVDSKKEGQNQKVNIKVPFQLLRAGVKLAAFMPKEAQSHITEALEEKGINLDLSNVKQENIEELISQLGDLSLDVDGDNEKVRIYCE